MSVVVCCLCISSLCSFIRIRDYRSVVKTLPKKSRRKSLRKSISIDCAMTGTLAISQDSAQDFILSVTLFLMLAVVLTGLCWTLLWCHLYVIFDKDKSKKLSPEGNVYRTL